MVNIDRNLTLIVIVDTIWWSDFGGLILDWTDFDIQNCWNPILNRQQFNLGWLITQEYPRAIPRELQTLLDEDYFSKILGLISID